MSPGGFSGTKSFWFRTSVTDRSLIRCASALLSGEFTTECTSSRSTSFFVARPSRAFAVRIRMALSSIRFCEIRPLLTAAATALIAASASGGISSTSAPASRDLHRRVAYRKSLRDPAHVERIGHHDTFESQLFSQHSVEDLRRQRRRDTRIIERGHGDMRRHHCIRAALDRRPEGSPLDLFEPRPVGRDRRQIQMRVGRGVAVSWKMLCGRQHARCPATECAPSMNAETNADTSSGFSP